MEIFKVIQIILCNSYHVIRYHILLNKINKAKFMPKNCSIAENLSIIFFTPVKTFQKF